MTSTGETHSIRRKACLFSILSKKFPHGQTWDGSQAFLRGEAQTTIRQSSETVLDIHPFYTIKQIKYFRGFFKYGVLTVHYSALQ